MQSPVNLTPPTFAGPKTSATSSSRTAPAHPNQLRQARSGWGEARLGGVRADQVDSDGPGFVIDFVENAQARRGVQAVDIGTAVSVYASRARIGSQSVNRLLHGTDLCAVGPTEPLVGHSGAGLDDDRVGRPVVARRAASA